jgi:hypothetical protein
MDARQVFDESLVKRAWAIEADRDTTKSISCSGRLKYALGRLVA